MTHPHTSFCEFFPLGGRLLTSRIMARKDVDTETPPQDYYSHPRQFELLVGVGGNPRTSDLSVPFRVEACGVRQLSKSGPRSDFTSSTLSRFP